jgi:hypothetical protein
LTLLAVAVAGCGGPTADFRRYETFAHKVAATVDIKFTRQQRQDIDETLEALFGTPDEPVFPAIEGIESGKIVSPSRLKLAAGAVGSDKQGNPRGLYREHCAHCHGISGDGAGPTAAFLNPYPQRVDGCYCASARDARPWRRQSTVCRRPKKTAERWTNRAHGPGRTRRRGRPRENLPNAGDVNNTADL